ncbi:hypothetical protein CBR_g51914 [Chara braunii]|uniref:Uncharacterized protein n=1 Tax=Chara braunii TaxID=69332 RepID=A0A388M982_CHABU|nr:hypothetical protein CBR_g51914 [Chara braunii]|eukprot:GBG91110.1 hypothetical protein CBR_g51914 [Chara braunii]
MAWSGGTGPPDHTVARSGVVESLKHTRAWSGVVESPDHTMASSSVPEPPNHATVWSDVPEPSDHTMAWSGVPEPPDHAMAWPSVPEPPDDTTAWSSVPEPPDHTTARSGVPKPPDHTVTWPGVPGPSGRHRGMPVRRMRRRRHGAVHRPETPCRSYGSCWLLRDAGPENQNVAHAGKESVHDPDGMGIEDDPLFQIPDDAPKQLAPCDNISYDMKEIKGGTHFLETKYTKSYEYEWGHHIVWHPGLFEPCVINRRWHMAIRMGGRWVFRERVLRSRFYEIAKDNLYTRVRQANKDALDDKISEKVNSLFEFLCENHLLEYCAAFYDKKSSPSYGAVIWSLDYRATDCMYDSDILVGCSQSLEGHKGARKTNESAAAGGGGKSVADKEGQFRMQNTRGDEVVDRPSSTPQPTFRPSEGISAVGARSETTPREGGEDVAHVHGDHAKDEKIEEDQQQKASHEEGQKIEAHQRVKGVAGYVDWHSKQSHGIHHTTVITTQTQGTDEATREQSANEKEGGEGQVFMECTGLGTQIVTESTMGERGGDVEGVSAAEHEKLPRTTNREGGEEKENEEEADKSQSVINLVDHSGENEETADKEEAKESREESQERERDLSEASEGICGRKRKAGMKKEECTMRR